MSPETTFETVFEIQRPSRRLLGFYTLRALLTGPGFPFVFLYFLFRYRTMRYCFDNEGISMSWGALFRKEVHLTYSRIQDIHLASGVLERYLGLARILIQTASGKSGAEMTIEGVLEYEQLRDFIYQKMRGLEDHSTITDQPPGTVVDGASNDPLVATLHEVAVTLRELTTLLENQARRSDGGS